jgi:hypothetical protein
MLGTGVTALREAAAFATCAHPLVVGRSVRETGARAAVVTLARLAGYRDVDIAASLDIMREAVRLLGHRSVDERLLSATRLRLAISEADAKL